MTVEGATFVSMETESKNAKPVLSRDSVNIRDAKIAVKIAVVRGFVSMANTNQLVLFVVVKGSVSMDASSINAKIAEEKGYVNMENEDQGAKFVAAVRSACIRDAKIAAKIVEGKGYVSMQEERIGAKIVQGAEILYHKNLFKSLFIFQNELSRSQTNHFSRNLYSNDPTNSSTLLYNSLYKAQSTLCTQSRFALYNPTISSLCNQIAIISLILSAFNHAISINIQTKSSCSNKPI